MTAYRIADAAGGQRGNLIACAGRGEWEPETFGEVLYRRRKAARLSQQALGEIAGIERSSISAWENDHKEPKPVYRYALRCALGLGEHDDGGWWETRW